jgi:hypothetical protein
MAQTVDPSVPTGQGDTFQAALQAAFVWKIGKEHHGESISTIPGGYLEWFMKNGKRPDHVEAATLELDRRRGQTAL